MIKTFPIEFLRKTLEQTLLEQHYLNNKYFGGKDQIALSSFYQQLKSQDEVDRFVETFRDLSEQQNRLNLIGNGILMSPENPTITNLYNCLIIPFSWTCSIRTTLENRDQMLGTINNLIKELKGRKVDIAQLDSVNENGFPHSEPFMVGTIGENDNAPQLENGVFIGAITNASDTNQLIENLIEKGCYVQDFTTFYLYCEHESKLKVVKAKWDRSDVAYSGGASELVGNREIHKSIVLERVVDTTKIEKITCRLDITSPLKTIVLTNGVVNSYENTTYDGQERTIIDAVFTLDQDIQDYVSNYENYSVSNTHVIINESEYEIVSDDGTIDGILFPPEHTSFEKYKLSLSFDSLRCDTPRTLNANEYCEISFGGSATLVNNGVQLGNDMIKICVEKLRIPASPTIDFTTNPDNPKWYLEPLEMPSGSNANKEISQLMSNKFISGSHTDALAITLQYTFICDFNIPLLKQWFKYARYGTQGLTANDISPNIIYGVSEFWSSWGEFENETYLAKIVENIDIENTESDTLTLSITFQKQGEND